MGEVASSERRLVWSLEFVNKLLDDVNLRVEAIEGDYHVFHFDGEGETIAATFFPGDGDDEEMMTRLIWSAFGGAGFGFALTLAELIKHDRQLAQMYGKFGFAHLAAVHSLSELETMLGIRVEPNGSLTLLPSSEPSLTDTSPLVEAAPVPSVQPESPESRAPSVKGGE